MSITLRRLVTDDEARVEAFLAGTAERTLFLRSNLSRVGLVDDGAPFGGTYAGAFDGDTLVAVGALYWNGNVVVAPGPYAARAAAHAVSLSGRTVNGILGPYEEVVESRAALGLRDAATSFFSKEVLYSLQLSELVVPLASTGTRVVVREPHPDELAALLEWRMLYAAETTHGEDTPETRASESERLTGYQARGHHFVATVMEERVAYSAFNATAPDVVQIGGVWTPPALRGRGYGRSVVAGSLQIARDRGARLAVLFTGEDNGAARAAYVSIGFRPIGDYAIVFFVTRG